ncbi:Beta-adaptin-like protein C [Glycine soja]
MVFFSLLRSSACYEKSSFLGTHTRKPLCYVAALYVAKLYDINAELVEDKGFLESLKDLISDNNPMVAANVVAELAEVQENSCSPIFEISSHRLSKLLTALNECTEYKAADTREAENIVERVTPRLQHANCAVVLSVVKDMFKSKGKDPLEGLGGPMTRARARKAKEALQQVLSILFEYKPKFQGEKSKVTILLQMELITSTDVVQNLCKKMAPPLVTLLSAEPKIQYVALRNINLIVQRRPTILAHEINELLQALICGIGYLEQPVLT